MISGQVPEVCVTAWKGEVIDKSSSTKSARKKQKEDNIAMTVRMLLDLHPSFKISSMESDCAVNLPNAVCLKLKGRSQSKTHKTIGSLSVPRIMYPAMTDSLTESISMEMQSAKTLLSAAKKMRKPKMFALLQALLSL